MNLFGGVITVTGITYMYIWMPVLRQTGRADG